MSEANRVVRKIYDDFRKQLVSFEKTHVSFRKRTLVDFVVGVFGSADPFGGGVSGGAQGGGWGEGRATSKHSFRTRRMYARTYHTNAFTRMRCVASRCVMTRGFWILLSHVPLASEPNGWRRRKVTFPRSRTRPGTHTFTERRPRKDRPHAAWRRPHEQMTTMRHSNGQVNAAFSSVADAGERCNSHCRCGNRCI